ncbi:hypothetical protein HIM_07593 [Hirsutella minnesotensis 3608]|uniref:Galactose oxidase n=1 Tax=Hirsutella minnesotensis 3608 TaxID=1043627 RepID=A0A0F7ZHP9_9HYPO|nr:hypothetical protein HIM_07593 [Hirsutella minnesotensis 3608]
MRLSILAFGASVLAGSQQSSFAGKWQELAPIPIAPRSEQTTVALSDSTIAILGGITAGGKGGGSPPTTDMMQLYNVTDNSWRLGPKIPVPLNHLNVAAVDGKIFLLGGHAVLPNGTWSAIPNSWMLDPAQGEWKPIAPMPNGTARAACATAVYGKTIYLAGGQTLNVPGVYQNSGGSQKEGDHVGGSIVGTTLYVIGGRHFGRKNVRNTVFTLDLNRPDDDWKEDPSKLPTARGGISIATIAKKIYVFGGEGNPAEGSDGIFNQTEAFDTVTRKWTTLAPMKLPRHGTSAAVTQGCAFLPGGSTVEGGPPVNYTDRFCPDNQ